MADTPLPLTLVGRADNDLCAVLRQSQIGFRRFDAAPEALAQAETGSGVVLLADVYPQALTCIAPAVFETAAGRGVRLYVEFPDSLPGIEVGAVREADWERGVVASDAFGTELARLRILMLHGCRFADIRAADPHLVLARVAGFDTAVYGLPDDTAPILFELPDRNLLVAATGLSQFVTGRYAPARAWGVVWRWILAWLCPQVTMPQLHWAPAVRPSYEADEALPADVERQAVRRGARWYEQARILIHPQWQDEAERRLAEWPDGTGPGPQQDWPAGDGTCGMIEGASARVHPDGSQDWRYYVRNDCVGETAMALAVAGTLSKDEHTRQIAANLNDFIYFDSIFARGPRADPASPSYGLLSWSSQPPATEIYYGDDNARSMLGTMAVAGLLGEDRWDEPLLKCLLANLRTTGPLGFRNGRLCDAELQEHGWRHFWETQRTHYAPHYESWLWACFLWAYQRTGFRPFLDRAATAIGMTMAAYPDQWRWTNGIQQERARMLLPLAWLVRVDGGAEPQRWLRFMAGELLAHQDACGAIREELGHLAEGSYGPPDSNAAYGTREAPLIQQNGDPLCDLLYTSNFALFGLHEAAAATGDAFYAGAADRLARFLCRIQVRAETQPALDGAWFRAFDFGRWDYWASNADVGWGAWSIESGWTQGWITAVLGLRQLRTSLWELTGESGVAQHLERLKAVMFGGADGVGGG